MAPITIETLRDDVEQVLFAGGSHDQDRTAAAADLAADLVRYLNHATIDARDAEQALPYPAITASVIASVQSLAQRLEQLLGQLAEREEAHADDPDLRAYGDDSPAEVIAGIVAADLRDAARSAAQLTAQLERAHNGAARLSVDVADQD